MDQLAKHAAEIALRLAALPADGSHDIKALDTIEHLAMAILKEVAAVRARTGRPVGETRGAWRIAQPLQRQ